MSSLLVFAEHVDGVFSGSSLGIIGKAKSLGVSVTAVTWGDAGAAASLGAHGAEHILVADTGAESTPSSGALASAVVAAVTQSTPSLVLFSASVLGAEVAGLAAAELGLGITTDVVDMNVDGEEVTVSKPCFGDSVYVSCGFSATAETRGIALVRAGTWPAQSPNGSHGTVEPLSVEDRFPRSARWLGREQAQAGGVDITKADILVGAGRGLGGPDKFGIVESLAQTLGGEVATTRAVVDAGWYDYATQIGQTGKTVTPKLYLAVGISGAIQHKVGMQNSGTIVAINKDPNAPIFEYSDFGIVGDLFDVVPKLEAALKARKG